MSLTITVNSVEYFMQATQPRYTYTESHKNVPHCFHL